MKYGETLRQRSIPAWSHYNIDYDDIKYFIKENTTAGKGKTVNVPGRGDKRLLDLENALFSILEEQHERIDLFVKSKAGEVQRRLDHAKRQLRQLSDRKPSTADKRIPIARLERYGKLENDVLKAGDEIRSLARFISTQRTAFRKLLKKFKKWTGSPGLEDRFRDEVLEEPKSFTKLDLNFLLDDYSALLHSIRSLYQTRLQDVASHRQLKSSTAPDGQSVIEQLRCALHNRSKIQFDVAMATIPLGEAGEMANYFVHKESVFELQVLLLQYMESYSSRSRSSSAVTPISTLSQAELSPADISPKVDYCMLIADNLDRFAQEQNALTVNEREHLPGQPPQRAKSFIRWNNEEDAVLSVRCGRSKTKSASLKRKHIDLFFEKDAPLPQKAEKYDATNGQALKVIRDEALKDSTVHPLLKLSSCRSRFTGINNRPNGFTLATLDTSISMQRADKDVDNTTTSDFPFAVLQVRHEGNATRDLLSILDRSHLLERVRGFSLQYHALWQLYKPQNFSPPFWLPILSRDIRKLPPPAIGRPDSVVGSGSGSQSLTRGSASTPNSLLGVTDGTTAVDTERRSSGTPLDALEAPPQKSVRKKRRRDYVETEEQTRRRYWSEYDNPEDGPDAYVIYIDPHEKSTIDKLLDKLGGLFGRRQREDEEPLLPSSATPDDDDTSDEETGLPHPNSSSYDTFMKSPSFGHSRRSLSRKGPKFLPPLTSICLVASVAILIVAYILRTTSKHKYATEVDAGIIFAIVCSLVFAVIGFIPLLNRRRGSWPARSVAALLVILDAIFSGFLLAWMLG